MVDPSLAVLDKDLAERVVLLADLDVRLVCIYGAIDAYHILQGLQDESSEDAECFYCYQRWGNTGSSGSKKIEGPFSEQKMREVFAEAFEARTGASWGSIKPGDRVAHGRFWWQQVAAVEEKAYWQYYVHDGVDGKSRGWYPYEDDASAEVEDVFAQHMSNNQESRTKIRTVSSGFFSYRIDLEAMTQENTKTGKVRAIRRFTATEAPPKGGKSTKGVRPAAGKRAPKAPVDRKKVTKKILKTAKSSKPGARKAKLTREAKPKSRKVAKKAVKVAKGKQAKEQVFLGKFTRTSTGLKKADLKRNKYGKVVSNLAAE
ncbi:ogfod2 [Symbiodinium natans]|uniref:Ogfod2 protein n=1 Tax=Symbiodinium natans TaxID=878477 RepID=A0A812QLM3_9DINO|nr:ogfod2 [Symbiodinium natans]